MNQESGIMSYESARFGRVFDLQKNGKNERIKNDC